MCFFQAEDGIRDIGVTGVQTCALPISTRSAHREERLMAQTTVEGVEGVLAKVGQHLGHSDWVEITQEQVNQFAEATHDHQWIHVDVERAKKESPFGGPIAHGYLTLSLVSALSAQIIEETGFRMGVNYR